MDEVKKRVRGPGKRARKVHASVRLDHDVYVTLVVKYGDSWRKYLNNVLRVGLLSKEITEEQPIVVLPTKEQDEAPPEEPANQQPVEKPPSEEPPNEEPPSPPQPRQNILEVIMHEADMEDLRQNILQQTKQTP